MRRRGKREHAIAASSRNGEGRPYGDLAKKVVTGTPAPLLAPGLAAMGGAFNARPRESAHGVSAKAHAEAVIVSTARTGSPNPGAAVST